MDQMRLGVYWGNEVDRAELQYQLSERNQTELDNIVQGWWANTKGLYQKGFVAYFDELVEAASG
jgi:hypothetical protein